jgi:hypothetical protein
MSAADFSLSENDFSNYEETFSTFEECEHELTVRVPQITAARGHHAFCITPDGIVCHDRFNPLQVIFKLTWSELVIDAYQVAYVEGTATAMPLTGPVSLRKQINDNHFWFDCHVAPDFWLKVGLKS